MRTLLNALAVTVAACGASPADAGEVSLTLPVAAMSAAATTSTTSLAAGVTVAYTQEDDSVHAVTAWPPTTVRVNRLDHYLVVVARDADGSVLASGKVAPPDTTFTFSVQADTVPTPTTVCVYANDAAGRHHPEEGKGWRCNPWKMPARLLLPGAPGVPTTDTVPDEPEPEPEPEEPPPPPDPVWPSEPTGVTAAIDEPFANITPMSQPAGSWGFAGWFDGNPSNAGGATRWTYDEGRFAGDSPGRAVISSSVLRFGTFYIGVRVRWSVPWTNHSSGVDKILYWGERSAALAGHATSQFMLIRRGSRAALVLQYGQSYAEMCHPDSQRNIPAPDCGEQYTHATRLDDGQWHTIEVLANQSTNGQANGRIRVYVDGLMQFDVADARFAPSGDALFYGINLDPVWGGTGGTVPQTQWMEMDHLRVSGR